MPVSAFRGLRLLKRRPRSWCVVFPECRSWLETHGLTSARDFLDLPGVVVSGHIGRNVSRVRIGSTTAYLKREHRVRRRDRLRSWADGFGWASVSEREAIVLRHLSAHKLPAPRWLAHGEADGEAFLLVEAATGRDLRTVGPVDDRLADSLGRSVARLHAAGVDQRDLFGKHFLVGDAVTILDWQRATIRPAVSWPTRVRALAAFRATISDEVMPAAAWEQFLVAYLSISRPRVSVSSFDRQVDAIARRLMDRRSIRAHRQPPAGAPQELVRLGGETVCAIPAVAPVLADADVVARLYDRGEDGSAVRIPGDEVGRLRVGRYRWPIARWWAAIRGKAWRSPELRTARLLFHLQRHGIPGPRLLAYGQRAPWIAPAGSFLLVEVASVQRPGHGDGALLSTLLRRLHEAGVAIRGLGRELEPFGIDGGRAVVFDASHLRLCRKLSARRARRDFARLKARLGDGG